MNAEDKRAIYEAFTSGNLSVLSVSRDKKVEWKRITDVTRHDVSEKEQYRVTAEGGATCTATGDHSLFLDSGDYIREHKTGDFKIGDYLVCVEGYEVKPKPVISNLVIPSERYMYDLTVEDNENFVLESGILAHNTFRPPSNEQFLQSQAQVFGYIWEDEELYEYLLMAVDDFNTAPPVTGISLHNMPIRWRSVILLKAASRACGAVAMNWVADEFTYSLSGISLDINKSAQYMQMKDSFEQEFDKSLDLTKRSIKIIKGLQMPKYGLGISSALGPYSRPGVQSRRNWAAGGGGWS